MNMKVVVGLLAAVVVAAGGFFMWKGDGGQKKRILFVDSYHQGYAWSDGITDGINGVLAGQNVELRIHRMDTKRNKSEEFKQEAGRKAKQVIDSWKPDVVIAADDNAQKYLVVPYFRGSDLPVVFAGVNWDASGYGYPAQNVTGMVEVEAPNQLFDILRNFAKGERLGSIGTNSETNRKVVQKYGELLGIYFEQDVYVDTFDQWKQAYLDMQGKVDMLFMYNNAGIEGWDDAEAAAFVRQHAQIPSGSAIRALLDLQAKTALRIINGESPAYIPIVRNQRGEMMVNSSIANRMGVEVPPSMLSAAARVLN